MDDELFNPSSPVISPMEFEYDLPFDLDGLSGLTQQIHPEVFDLLDDLSQDISDIPSPSQPPSPSPLSQTILSPPTPFKDHSDLPEPLPTTNQDPRKRYLASMYSSEPLEPPKKKQKPNPTNNIQPHNITPPVPQPQPHCSYNPPTTHYPPPQAVQCNLPMTGSGQRLPSMQIISEEERHIKKYATNARWVTLRFRDLRAAENFECYLKDMLNDLLEFLVNHDVQNHDRVGLSIINGGRPEQRPVGVSIRRADQLSADVILRSIEQVVQSNETFFLDGPLEVKFLHIKMDNGTSKKRGRIDYTSSFDDYCKRTRGIIRIVNQQDNLCLARALVVAIARSKKDNTEEDLTHFKRVKRTKTSYQKQEAERLCRDADVDLTNGGGVDEVRQFQHYLQDFCITVFTDRRGGQIMFEGPRSTTTQPRKNLDLIYGNGHFNCISSLTAAFATDRYCRPCKKAYASLEEHRCPLKCLSCNHTPICEARCGDEKIICLECNRYFMNQQCMTNHNRPLYTKKQTTCQVVKCCPQCKKVYNKLNSKKHHVCGESYCSVCDKHQPSGHLCFIRRDKRKTLPETTKFMYIYYDFECTQDTPTNNAGTFEHTPNLCATQHVCYKCVNDDGIVNDCDTCGSRQQVFSGETTLPDFMNFIIKPRPQFSKIILIAHNMKAYDGQFVVRYMVDILKWTPEVIMSGSKIQVVSHDKLKFLDSLSFFNTKLSALPSMFDLQCESKGYFPHLFNRKENWNYNGVLPAPEYYGCDTMKEDDREEFLKWYNLEKETNDQFNLQKDLERYCIQDVNILRQACLKFRQLFVKENQIDPLLQCITIASACMLTYRKHFLKEDSIGVIPPGGYRLKDRQSKTALQWLRWMERTSGLAIQHAGNGREALICGYKVDGYSETPAGDKTVYEFHGCWFHGCELCFRDRTTPINNAPKETMGTRMESTRLKTSTLIRNGYKVIEMWECAFNLLKAQNEDLKQFVRCAEDLDRQPLDPRDAFFGGRTNCTKLYYEADLSKGEKIRYLDVCSLYPWACKNGQFPIKHPRVLMGDDCPQDLNGVDGVVKATILPPSNLYHPVLPVRIHGKLFFPLCKKCVEDLNQQDCHHAPEERQLSGTWISDELKLAISKGYKLVKVHEIWQYETTQYNGRDGGLFVGYINKFLKLKQEASGWPEWVRTEEDKDRYIEEFEGREGIQLSKESVKKNPGFRALAKMLLNSFWGKFGQRNNLSKTTFVKEREELTALLVNPNYEVSDVVPINDDVMIVNWNEIDDSMTPLPMTSVVIAAYVTSIARMKLYSYLDMLGERVLYFDTDSIIFVDQPGVPSPPTGDFLGDLTDELLEYGEGSFIDIFVSGGPKNYAYRVRVRGGVDTRTKCKVKGINLHFQNASEINFETMRDMVVDSTPSHIVLHGQKIGRTREFNVVTRPDKKTYRVVYTKRRRVDDYDTLPFGFKRVVE